MVDNYLIELSGVLEACTPTSNVRRKRDDVSKHLGKSCALCAFDKDGKWTIWGEKLGVSFATQVFALNNDRLSEPKRTLAHYR